MSPTRLTKPRLHKGQKREHAPGFSFFRAVRIVAIQIARGADAAVVYGRDAEIATLPRDLAGKIRFVMRRTNAWTELHDEIRGA